MDTGSPSHGHTALVLSGGGARAAYQVGVLAAIAEILPGARFSVLTGVSAGAINAAFLGAHEGTTAAAVAELHGHWKQLTAAQVYAARPTRIALQAARRLGLSLLGRSAPPAHLPGLLDLTPLRRFLGHSIRWDGIEANLVAGRLRALALTATPYSKAASRTFVQGVEEIAMWERAERVAVRARIGIDHVMASSAIPILFPAVWIDGEFYGDGSVRQMAPLANAIHLGATRILVIGMHAPRSRSLAEQAPREAPTIAEGMALLLNAIFNDAMEADAERLDRINRLIQAIPPGTPSPDGLRPVRFLHLRPSRYLSSLVPDSRARPPAVMRWILRALGSETRDSRVLLSYLLFDPAYTGLLMEMGYEDGLRARAEVQAFLSEGG